MSAWRRLFETMEQLEVERKITFISQRWQLYFSPFFRNILSFNMYSVLIRICYFTYYIIKIFEGTFFRSSNNYLDKWCVYRTYLYLIFQSLSCSIELATMYFPSSQIYNNNNNNNNKKSNQISVWCQSSSLYSKL